MKEPVVLSLRLAVWVSLSDSCVAKFEELPNLKHLDRVLDAQDGESCVVVLAKNALSGRTRAYLRYLGLVHHASGDDQGSRRVDWILCCPPCNSGRGDLMPPGTAILARVPPDRENR